MPQERLHSTTQSQTDSPTPQTHTETAPDPLPLGILQAPQFQTPPNRPQRISAAQRLQRQIGNQATARLLRRAPDPANDASNDKGPPVTIILEGVTITQCGHGATLALGLAQDLEGALKEAPAAPNAADIKKFADDKMVLVDEGRMRATEPLDQGYADDLSDFHDRYTKLLEDLDKYKKEETEKKLKAEQKKIEDAAAAAEVQQEIIAEAMRSFFKDGPEDELAALTGMLGTYLDLGMTLHDTSRTITEAILKMDGLKMPPASAGAEMLAAANIALAAINSFLAAKAVAGAKTGNDKAFAKIAAASTYYSAGATILGAATGVTLFTSAGLLANLYIGPMAAEAVSRAKVIVDKKLREYQEYGLVMGDEDVKLGQNHVGGGAMYNFMVQVMHGGSAADVPWEAAPESVKETFVKYYERFSAVGKSEMPTTGMWFWRDVDAGKIKGWIFGNRQSLWASLYGKWKTPDDPSFRVKED